MLESLALVLTLAGSTGECGLTNAGCAPPVVSLPVEEAVTLAPIGAAEKSEAKACAKRDRGLLKGHARRHAKRVARRGARMPNS
jgi:hypothetical protein